MMNVKYSIAVLFCLNPFQRIVLLSYSSGSPVFYDLLPCVLQLPTNPTSAPHSQTGLFTIRTQLPICFLSSSVFELNTTRDIHAWTNPTISEYYLLHFSANIFASRFSAALEFLTIIPPTLYTRGVNSRLIEQNFSW